MLETSTTLGAHLKLRPLRLGLLARPDDARSISRFIEFCCCVWGGAFNPIIPVYDRTPRLWRQGRSTETPTNVTAGYIRFFEPDVFVEAEAGLAAKAGLKMHDQRHSLRTKIMPLARVLDDGNHREWSDLAIGLNIVDAYADIYKRERQFRVHEPTKAITLARRPAHLAYKAMYGAFPKYDKVKYIGDNYVEVFAPTVLTNPVDIWRSAYLDHAITPIRATIHEIDIARYWHHTPKVFVFNPSSTLSNDHSDRVATSLPYNTDGADWPVLVRSLAASTVSSEGWAITERFVGTSQPLELLTHEQAVIGALKVVNVEARPSEPGYIGQQIIAHLGGLFGTSLIRDRGTVEMLNRMAMGYRRRESEKGTAEEVFDRRSKGIQDWTGLIKRRNAKPLGRSVDLDEFTSKGIIKLGIQTSCPHCKYVNWTGLKAVDYDLGCERCQQEYSFPQANLNSNNRNWAYRAAGPFAVPDYARGSYATVLTLGVLKNFRFSMDALTFYPGLLIEVDGKNFEFDFAALHAGERLLDYDEPRWVFGETKSLGRGDLLRQRDLQKLWHIASIFPKSCLTVSVMRDVFTRNEVSILKKLRRKCAAKRHPLLLLTGNELFYDFSISETWKQLGGKHARHAEYHDVRSLEEFAAATQDIYLS